MVKPRIRHRLLTNRLFYAGLISLLSACGGGGDKPADPTADLTPQSVPATFSVVETRQSGTNPKINVVDLTSGTTVRSYDLAGELRSDEYPSADWHATTRNTLDTDGLGYQVEGISQLTFIQQRKVMLLDLNANSVGSAKQISSLTNACGIDRDATYIAPDGQHVWLKVETAGLDADCAQRGDNQTVLISSDMSALDASIASGKTSGLTLITALRDTSSAQQSKGLLVLRRDTGILSVYDNKLKTRLYDVAVTDHMLLPTEVVRSLTHSPNKRQQELIQLGASVYLADWHTPQLQLSRPVATVDATVNNPVAIVDADTFYLGFGNRGLAISATSQTQIADIIFPVERGDIVQAWPTTSGVVVKQAIRSGSVTSGSVSSSGAVTSSPIAAAAEPASTLWFFKKADGTYKHLASSSTSSEFTISGVHGDTLFFSQKSNTLPVWEQLLKTVVSSPIIESVATGVLLVDQVRAPHRRAGADSVTQVLWCEPTNTAASTGCASSKLFAYALDGTAKKTQLGTLAVSDGLLGAKLFGLGLTWTSRNSLIELVRGKATSYTSDIWMINPDTANSLTTVSAVTAPL